MPTLTPRTPVRPSPPASKHKATSLIGATMGLLAFLFVGLLPSMLVGGSTGANLAQRILGMQGGPGLGANALVLLSVVAAATIGAVSFAALGAAGGAVFSVLTSTRGAFRDAT